MGCLISLNNGKNGWDYNDEDAEFFNFSDEDAAEFLYDNNNNSFFKYYEFNCAMSLTTDNDQTVDQSREVRNEPEHKLDHEQETNLINFD